MTKENMKDNEHWLGEHFFSKEGEEWKLRDYNGLLVRVSHGEDGWNAWASLNNESVTAVAENDYTYDSAETAVMCAFDNLRDEIKLFLEDLDVTERALRSKLNYAECEAGFYDGMPGLEGTHEQNS